MTAVDCNRETLNQRLPAVEFGGSLVGSTQLVESGRQNRDYDLRVDCEIESRSSTFDSRAVDLDIPARCRAREILVLNTSGGLCFGAKKTRPVLGSQRWPMFLRNRDLRATAFASRAGPAGHSTFRINTARREVDELAEGKEKY
jgi:hypothetical protein